MAHTFVQFILSFRADNSPFGDLARDMMEDPAVTAHTGYKALLSHIPGRIDLLDELWALYRASRPGRREIR